MLKELFLNASILIACISLGNQILINQEVKPSSPLKLRLFFSIMAGILGILLMKNSIIIKQPDIIIDFRNIAIMLTAIYCGFVPSIITGLIIGLFNLFHTDLSILTISKFITAIVIAIGCGFISRLFLSRLKKWVVMSLFTLIVPSITLILVVDRSISLKLIFSYWIILSIALVLVYLYVGYLDVSKVTYRMYQRDSLKDHRTGLNNVRQFDNEFHKIFKGLTDNCLITMLFIDIDFFKRVNDFNGHLNGDKVLEDLGKILLSTCNVSDIVSGNGGEEFSVLMTDCPRDKVLEVAERIRTVVQDHKFYLIDGQTINITISMGVAIYPDTVDDINKLVEKADESLYEAKRSGRNKVVMLEA